MQLNTKAWVVKEDLSDDVKPTAERQQILDDGAEAESTVVQYSDWLVSMCNISIPDSSWSFPDPHPCS